MNNASISSIPLASGEMGSEKQEVFSSDTMKNEFISIIHNLLINYEKSFFSYENMIKIIQADNEWKNFIKIINYPIEVKNKEDEINGEIKLFISKYQEYFNIDLFRTIFNNAYWLKNEGTNNIKIIKEYISAKIALEKEEKRKRGVNGKKTNSIYNIENENNKCKGDINKLLGFDENLFGYTIFKIFEQKIIEIKDLNHLPYWIEILQKTPILENTITKTEIDNYLFKYKNQISTEMLFGLLDSDKGEETLNEILANPENSTQKMDICLFIMEYKKEKYALHMPKIFKTCISCMNDKIGSSYSTNGIGCNVKDLIKIYEYYKENKATISPELNVEGVFETYSELYTADDFYHNRNLLYTGELPVTYVKIAFSGYIEMIIDIKNPDDVESGLQQDGIINTFYENNFLLIDTIYQLYKQISDGGNEISKDYVNKYSSIVRRILYSELNLRIYGDNKKQYDLHIINIRKAQKELEGMATELTGDSSSESDNQDSEYEVFGDLNVNTQTNITKDKGDDGEEVPF